MNAALTWLADRPAWALTLAWWTLLTGVTAFVFIRITEVLSDEDMPLTLATVPAVAAVPVTLDLGLYGPNLDALEATS